MDPPRQPGDVVEWLEDYARDVERDDYEVEEGFGECYLAKRSRRAR